MAFVLPAFASEVTSHRIYMRSSGKCSRRCVQPRLSTDCRTVTWELQRPAIGRTYVLVGFYVGGQALFESYAPGGAWWHEAWVRLKKRIRPLSTPRTPESSL
jgi:hypothetical protein